MASKFQVRVYGDVFKVLRRQITEANKHVSKRVAREAGEAVVDAMRKKILNGTSPIQGRGKFEAYRGEYRKRIIRGGIPGKKLRPVNLYLTGKFLQSLKVVEIKRVRNYNTPVIFFDARYKPSSEDKEDGHRAGTNGQARRPILPNARENLMPSILREAVRIIREALEIGIKRGVR